MFNYKTTKIKFVLFSLLIGLKLLAQNHKSTQIIGTWTQINPNKESNQVYSFSPNNTYQIKYSLNYNDSIPFLKLDTSLTEAGKYRLKKNIIVFTDCNAISKPYRKLWPRYRCFYSLNDSGFFLSETKKAMLEKQNRVTIEPLVEPADIYDFKKHNKNCVYLVNSLTPELKVKLTNASSPKLMFLEDKPKPEIIQRWIILEGQLSYLTDSTLQCDLEERRIATLFQNNTIKDTSIYSMKLYTGAIKIKDIHSIEFNTKKRNRRCFIGGAISFVSIILIGEGLLLPVFIKDMKAKEGLGLVAYGAAGLAIGIPIMKLNKPKTYRIGNKANSDANIWYLDK